MKKLVLPTFNPPKGLRSLASRIGKEVSICICCKEVREGDLPNRLCDYCLDWRNKAHFLNYDVKPECTDRECKVCHQTKTLNKFKFEPFRMLTRKVKAIHGWKMNTPEEEAQGFKLIKEARGGYVGFICFTCLMNKGKEDAHKYENNVSKENSDLAYQKKRGSLTHKLKTLVSNATLDGVKNFITILQLKILYKNPYCYYSGIKLNWRKIIAGYCFDRIGKISFGGDGIRGGHYHIDNVVLCIYSFNILREGLNLSVSDFKKLIDYLKKDNKQVFLEMCRLARKDETKKMVTLFYKKWYIKEYFNLPVNPRINSKRK